MINFLLQVVPESAISVDELWDKLLQAVIGELHRCGYVVAPDVERELVDEHGFSQEYRIVPGPATLTVVRDDRGSGTPKTGRCGSVSRRWVNLSKTTSLLPRRSSIRDCSANGRPKVPLAGDDGDDGDDTASRCAGQRSEWTRQQAAKLGGDLREFLAVVKKTGVERDPPHQRQQHLGER